MKKKLKRKNFEIIQKLNKLKKLKNNEKKLEKMKIKES